MSSGLFYLKSLDKSISYLKDVCCFFLLLPCFVDIYDFNANSVDPDLTPRSAVSDLGLLCLSMSHL